MLIYNEDDPIKRRPEEKLRVREKILKNLKLKKIDFPSHVKLLGFGLSEKNKQHQTSIWLIKYEKLIF